MISIENVKHFSAVVENGGVLRASEKLFISASSITRSLQLIEAEVGMPLFDRIGRALRINQTGQDFYRRASELLSQFKSLLSPDLLQKDLSGHFRVGASHFLCESLLGGMLFEVSRQYPNLVFETHSMDTSHLLRRIHDGEMDIGFVFSPFRSETIEFEIIGEGEMVLCGGKKHPLASFKFNELKKRLNEFPAIIHRPTDSVERCDNHPMFKKHGIKPVFQMYWDSDCLAASVLSKNKHWTMLPDIVLKERPYLKKFDLPRDWHAPYKIGMVWNKNKTNSALREAILNRISPQ